MELVLFWIAIVMVLSGTVVQVFLLPGFALQFITILIYSVLTGFDRVTVPELFVMLLIVVVAGLVDNLAILLGAKKFGASKYGMVGAFLGAIISLVSLQLWSLILFPFLGAVLFEYLFNEKKFKKSMKAGAGTFIGFLTGYFLKLAISIAIFVWFVIQ